MLDVLVGLGRLHRRVEMQLLDRRVNREQVREIVEHLLLRFAAALLEAREQRVDVAVLRLEQFDRVHGDTPPRVAGCKARAYAVRGARLATHASHGDPASAADADFAVRRTDFERGVRLGGPRPLRPASPKEQPFLTGVVAAAAAWPVLLLGIGLPK